MNKEPIKIGDIVFFILTKLYFRCENKKQEKWMNESKFHIKSDKSQIPPGFYRI